MDERLQLIALTPDGQRHQWALEPGEYRVGRGDGSPDLLAVPGDPHLSRQHFRLIVRGERLEVERLAGARNPIFFQGQEQLSFSLAPGQVFSAGKTQFSLGQPAAREGTLFGASRERARLRRLEDCFKASTQVLERLRQDVGGNAPWKAAFGVLLQLLPDLQQMAFVHRGQGLRLVDCWPQPARLEFWPEGVNQALLQWVTTTQVQALPTPGEEGMTLSSAVGWQVVSPLQGLESQAYALVGLGVGALEPQELEELAAIIEVVAEMIGHHMMVAQAAEYSNLLGVFGHHVGTLFKTSGALNLWTDPECPPPVRQVLQRLLPIWGVSQAISLHKKRGDRSRAALPPAWLTGQTPEPQAIEACLLSLAIYVRDSQPEPPFLPWSIDLGETARPPLGPLRSIDLGETARPPLGPLRSIDRGEAAGGGLRSLPPLADNPLVFDKTLALTMGLLEMLSNLRNYPEPRGAGREDRRELLELSQEQRQVTIQVGSQDGVSWLEIRQPVVLTGEGQIPQSRSLERIRALEKLLLAGLVETGPAQAVGTLPIPHLLIVAQRWSYFWGCLCENSDSG